MQLVILAAGHGRRFGGLKQLAPVGPNGEAIMDYTATTARRCGFDEIVLVVREEIASEIADHISEIWPADLAVEIVCQAPTPGTAQAVLSTERVINGPFAVANADDLYGTDALSKLACALGSSASVVSAGVHTLVSYRLVQTVLTAAPVTRGLCAIASDGSLTAIIEHTVVLRPDGQFNAYELGSNARTSAPCVLSGAEAVSMNLWGFHPSVFDDLSSAIRAFNPETGRRQELLLPDVVEDLIVSRRAAVSVTDTAERCIGVTHPDDIALVRDEIGDEALGALRSARLN